MGNGILFFSSARDESGFGKEKVNEALTLLDATDAERDEVLSIFERAGANIQKAEMANLRVKEVAPHEVVLDATRVREPVKEVLGQMRSELGAAMDGPRGQALVESIAWDYAHPTQAAAVDPNGVPAPGPAPYRLQIVRSHGQLMARCHTERGWTSYPLPAKYVDDGSAIPAGEVFGERWKSITSGVSLVPMAEE
ncbi:hypothetical protein [Luteolibacter sp. Populi]|uniref:hypothetical protein n=1 Tax=Luteolibacter sp. Populi TaxID=3230487 RepID=UPI003466ABE8